MDTKRYRREVDARLNLDSQKKQAWIEELSGRSAFAESSDPRDRPYLSYAPPPPPRRPVWLRWAAAAAAVLLLAGAAFAFWPRRGLETAGEGNASGGRRFADRYDRPVHAARRLRRDDGGRRSTKATASVTSTAAGNRTNSPVAFDPDDPLAVFQDPYYIYSGFSQEQATAVFAAVDTVQELMSLNNDWSFYGRDVWKQEIVFSGMAGMREGTSYSLAENYQSNTLGAPGIGRTAERLSSPPSPFLPAQFCRRLPPICTRLYSCQYPDARHSRPDTGRRACGSPG